ncbi:hypothetical protein [Allobaculum sp. Allo2]|uniref:hypothetical protein n=1 Tax=Allobaculum sp. Allo2 TaxID=2853432 RepID=UPI001F60701E|nr:hypothetical protein [Allobaculum sp. Allo2]
MEFETPAIGGKDSMSGTFNDIHVPPTLITFATAVTDTDHVISSAFKEPGHLIYLVRHIPEKDGSPNYEQLKHNFASIQEENENGHIAAARIVKDGGVGAALAIMAFGNEIGVNASVDDPFGFGIGSIVVETTEDIDRDNWILLGHTTKAQDITLNEKRKASRRPMPPGANATPVSIRLKRPPEQKKTHRKPKPFQPILLRSAIPK